jgi:hypothetical protein
MVTAKKASTPRKQKSAADIESEIKAKKQELAKLEQLMAYQAVADKIKHSPLVAEFKKLRDELAGKVSDVALLAAVGKELEIKRLVVTQSEPVKRAPKGTGAKAVAKKAAVSK